MPAGSSPLKTPLVSVAITSPLPVADTFEQRWAAWQARGAAHDRAVGRKFAIALPILAVVAGVVYLLLAQ